MTTAQGEIRVLGQHSHSHSHAVSDDDSSKPSQFSVPPVQDLEASIANEDDPIAKRVRSVFYLKHIGSERAIDALAKGLSNALSLFARTSY